MVVKNIKSWMLFADENALLYPTLQSGSSSSILVVFGGIRRPVFAKLKPNYIVWAPMIIKSLLIRGNHVIGRADN